MEIHEFTGGIFQTNGYLVEDQGRRLLIDAPEGVCDWLVESELAPDLVLFTHLHYDHVVDAAALKAQFGCPLWSHSEPNPDLTLESVLQQMPGADFNIEPFSIDRTLAGLDSVEIDSSGTIDLLHIPGHSPDSLCFLPRLTDANEARSLVFGGDVLFQGSIGRTDFPHGSHQQLIEGIKEKLLPLPGDTVVFPGHGPSTTIAHERISNPFVRA